MIFTVSPFIENTSNAVSVIVPTFRSGQDGHHAHAHADCVVTVEFVNLGLSVLGEVNAPGRYSIDRDCITILDAISMAGDITRHGNRRKVTVMRTEDGVQKSYTLNLLSAEDALSSPAYYLRQNDIVYVSNK